MFSIKSKRFKLSDKSDDLGLEIEEAIDSELVDSMPSDGLVRPIQPQECPRKLSLYLGDLRQADFPEDFPDKCQDLLRCMLGSSFQKSSIPDVLATVLAADHSKDLLNLMKQWLQVMVNHAEYSPCDFEQRMNDFIGNCGMLMESCLGPAWNGHVHLGTLVSRAHRFALEMRYATTDDRGSGTSQFNQWNASNGCVNVKEYITALWIAAENAKRCGKYEKGEKYYIKVESAGFDFIPVTLEKGTESQLKEQCDQICQALNDITRAQLTFLSFLISTAHCLNHFKHHGKPMPLDIGSSYVVKDILGVNNRVVIRCEWVHYHVTCHGQVLLTGCQLAWDEEKRKELGDVITSFWSTILGLPTGYITELANEFGRNGRSDAVIEEMRKIRSGIQKALWKLGIHNFQTFKKTIDGVEYTGVAAIQKALWDSDTHPFQTFKKTINGKTYKGRAATGAMNAVSMIGKTHASSKKRKQEEAAGVEYEPGVSISGERFKVVIQFPKVGRTQFGRAHKTVDDANIVCRKVRAWIEENKSDFTESNLEEKARECKIFVGVKV